MIRSNSDRVGAFFVTASVFLGAALAVPAASFAQITVDIASPNLTFQQSSQAQTGTLEVFFTSGVNTSGQPLAGDTVGLQLPSQNFVTFTSEGVTVTRPYVYGTASQPEFGLSTPNLAVITDNPNSGSVPLPNFTFSPGLLLANFSIAPNTPVGTYALTFDVNSPLSDPAATNFQTGALDGNFNPVTYPFTANGAFINVIPEPASCVTILAAVALLSQRRRHTPIT